MNGSVAGLFGNLFIGAGVVLSGLALGGPHTATALVGVGLLVSGCLLRIEAAILRGQPVPESLRRNPGPTRRGSGEVLHLPEPAGDIRPWHEPDDQR